MIFKHNRCRVFRLITVYYTSSISQRLLLTTFLNTQKQKILQFYDYTVSAERLPARLIFRKTVVRFGCENINTGPEFLTQLYTHVQAYIYVYIYVHTHTHAGTLIYLLIKTHFLVFRVNNSVV